VALTPAAALADVLRAGLAGALPALDSLAVLLAWALGAPLLAARLFRWW
jgi:ABC-2 type transport system permease protein